MPITEFLERNAREFPNDICLVEINPEIKEDRRVHGRNMSLLSQILRPATAERFHGVYLMKRQTDLLIYLSSVV